MSDSAKEPESFGTALILTPVTSNRDDYRRKTVARNDVSLPMWKNIWKWGLPLGIPIWWVLDKLYLWYPLQLFFGLLARSQSNGRIIGRVGLFVAVVLAIALFRTWRTQSGLGATQVVKDIHAARRGALGAVYTGSYPNPPHIDQFILTPGCYPVHTTD